MRTKNTSTYRSEMVSVEDDDVVRNDTMSHEQGWGKCCRMQKTDEEKHEDESAVEPGFGGF